VFLREFRRVRSGNAWLQSDFKPISGSGEEKIISGLPAVMFVADGEDGTSVLKTNKTKLGLFLAGDDLTDFGYPGITPLFGCDIANEARWNLDYFAIDPPIYAVAPTKPAFTYIPAAERDMEWVRTHLENCFPGYRFDLLVLLVAIKGMLQLGNVDEVPVVFITGPSSGGKTAHCRLAAMLSFDRVTVIKIKADRSRMEQAYARASLHGSFAVFNEADKQGVSGREVMEACLHFEKGLTYHHLYQGPREIERPAAILMTDPRMPEEVKDDPQTQRRTVHYHMGAGIFGGVKVRRDWYDTCGSGNIENWLKRDPLGTNHRCACMLVSYVADTFFPAGSNPQLKDIASALQIGTLAQKDGGCNAELLEFCRAVLTAPESPPDKSRRIVGQAWRRFTPGDRSALAEAFEGVAPNGNTQRIESATWSLITGIAGLEVEVKRLPGRSVIGIRFLAKTPGGVVYPTAADLPGGEVATNGESPVESPPSRQ
jgi:hypothetical protein